MTAKRLAHRSGHGNRGRPPGLYDFIAKSLSQTRDFEGLNERHRRRGWDSLGFFESGVLLDELLLAITGKTDGQLDLVTGAFATQNQAPSVLCVAHV